MWISSLFKKLRKDGSGAAQDLLTAQTAERLLQAFMDNSVDYIYFKDLDSKFIKVNLAWARTWGTAAGCDPEKIIGKSDFDFFPKQDAEIKFHDEQEIIRTGKPLYNKEECNVQESGHAGWVSTIKMPLRDPDGNIIGTFGVSRDITDIKHANQALENYKNNLEKLVQERTAQLERDIIHRKLIEEQLRDSEENLSITLSSIGDAVIATTAEGTIARMNMPAEKYTGWPSSEAEGRPLKEVFQIVDARTRQLLDNPFELVLNGVAVRSFSKEATLISRDGRECNIAGNAAPMRGKNGRILGVVIVFRDITEQRMLEKQLRQAERMRVIGQLAGGIAHDFNNQITGIVGCAEMLKLLVQDEEARRYVQMIMSSSAHAADLTAKLLAFARRGAYQSLPVDVHKIVSEVAALLERTIDKRIRLKQDLRASPSIIMGDPTQIQNALLNIAINSRDALLDGGDITFATRVVDLDDGFLARHPEGIVPGKYIEIAISDSGVGMTEEVQAHIFEPFFTTKKEGKGTGMGLAAVYGTVRSHKGAISVYSEPGHGSTFKIYLMQAEGAELQKQEPPVTAPAKGSASILIIDDEDIVRQALADMMKSLGYRPRLCKDGLEGVEYYKRNWQQIDLIILDMVMPELGGRDTFLALAQINPALKVIVSSGFSLNRSVQEVIDKGALGFLQKPFLLNDLAKRVADALKQAHAQTAQD